MTKTLLSSSIRPEVSIMDSRKLVPVIGMVIWSAVALTAAPHARSHRHAVELRSYGEDPISSCSDLDMRFDYRRARVESEERTIQKAQASTLRVQAEANGGIQVEGWDSTDYGVTLCKAVEPGSDAENLLSQIHLTFQNGELGVSGPSSHARWSTHILVKAPKEASLDLQVNNGPMGLFRVDGNLKARAQNGPITVIGCNGDVSLSTQNGPVTLQGNSGRLRVEAQNGPLTISLSGKNWTGSGIEARANNGPLTLEIPSGYQSGVLVESAGHSPFQCHSSVCSEGRKNWEEDSKSIEFGSGPTVIHLSTVNGPVSVH
jgi:DUF4097 and DUF4098 domain-containing protein YvlB